MAGEHVLRTELSIEECKNRLKENVGMATFFPEMRGKSLIGGIKKNRFWIQDSIEASSRYQLGGSLFHGRLTTDPLGGTRVTGDFGLSAIGRLQVIVLVLGSCALTAFVALHRPVELKRLVWLALGAGWVAAWTTLERRLSRHRRPKLLSLLRRVLEAESEKHSDKDLIRH